MLNCPWRITPDFALRTYLDAELASVSPTYRRFRRTCTRQTPDLSFAKVAASACADPPKSREKRRAMS